MGRQSSFTQETAVAEIYGLFDPRDGALRYIGKANCAAARLKTHLRDARRRKTPVYAWINKLGRLGMVPALKVLERAQEWREAERRLIALSRAKGERLLNLADGGDQPFCSPAILRSNGSALAARVVGDAGFRNLRELKRKIAVALRDGLGSNAARAKLRKAAALRPDLFGGYAFIQDRDERHAS